MVISSPRAADKPHNISCRDADGSQRVIGGHADASMAELARHSQLCDGLARLILYGKAVQTWRLWDTTMFHRTSLQLLWRGDAPTDHPVGFLLRPLRHGETWPFLLWQLTLPWANYR